jgi:hypothetical protein
VRITRRRLLLKNFPRSGGSAVTVSTDRGVRLLPLPRRKDGLLGGPTLQRRSFNG